MLFDKILKRNEAEDRIEENNKEEHTQECYLDESIYESESLYQSESIYENVEECSFISEELYNQDDEEYTVVGNKEISKVLDGISKYGISIVVTGAGGSGVSTVSFNMANMLSNLGYKVLIVDFDTEQKAQSYISSRSYQSIRKEGTDLIDVVNDGLQLENHAAFVKKNLYLLTLGAATDSIKFNDALNTNKIPNFIGLSKSMFNFVIYDIPINSIIEYSPQIAILCDTLITVIDSSTWGGMKAINSLLNIENEELLDTFFSKSRVVFNRVSSECSLMGKPFNPSKKGWGKTLDSIVEQLAGEEMDVKFSDLGRASILKLSSINSTMWYEKRAYSDTKEGNIEYMRLIKETFY